MARILFFLTLFSSSITFSQCIELYISQYIQGDPICNLSNGSSISICEDTKEIIGCPQTFYIKRVYTNANGFYVYDFALDNVYYSQKYGELQVNPKTQKLGILIGNRYGVYSYLNENQMASKLAADAERERSNNKSRAERWKLEDEKTLTGIKSALQQNDYFTALQLYNNLHDRFQNGLLNTINLGWDKEKERLNFIYQTYLKNYELLRKEYYSSPDNFTLRYQKDIQKKEITINGNEAHLKRVEFTSDLERKKSRLKTLNDDGYLYSKKEGKHLLCPVGVHGGYFTWRYNTKYVDFMDIHVMYDTSANIHVPFIDFMKNGVAIMRAPIVNTNVFQINFMNVPYPSDIEAYHKKIINDSGKEILNSLYPQQVIYFDSHESISLNNLNTINYPGDGVKNDKYTSLKGEFSSQSNQIRDLTKDKITLYTKNLYNPSLLYLLKKMYDTSDSLVLLIGDYREISDWGLHFGWGSLIPLEKGMSDLKGDQLILTEKSGNYHEIKVNLLQESKISLKNINLEELILDSTFFELKDGKINFEKPYPLSYRQLVLEYSDNPQFRFNEEISIQLFSVLKTAGEGAPYIPKEKKMPLMEDVNFKFSRPDLSYYKTAEYFGSGGWIFDPQNNSLQKYLSEHTKYLRFKAEGNSKKASKALNNANKYLEEFKQIYFGG